MTPEFFGTMARYNRWMNGKLLEICAGIPDERRKTDTGAPFRSIHGVLNHLLLTDKVWLGRFNGTPFPINSLADELHADFEALRRDRERTDNAIDEFVAGLTPERLAAPITYISAVNPQQRTYPLWVCVGHLFNHQTHHRGQLTALIEQAGADCGITDLLWMPGMQIQD